MKLNYGPKNTTKPEPQIAAMKKFFPQFRAERCGCGVTFTGKLQVKSDLPTYKVKVEYRGCLSPRVTVIPPQPAPAAPHLYRGDFLCLYHPDDFHWNQNKLVAKEVMQWTCAWLYFYEYWLQTGEWVGPEVPHGDVKKKIE